jgi:diketogulonate reductase-like aldo/keto reductase
MLPLTGTTNPQHMKDDLACERFTLTPDELVLIETIGQ